MNETIYKCPVCDKPMKFIEAGVSKKNGKPYDAFYGCTAYGCKGSRKADGTAKMAYVNKPYTPQESFDAKIQQSVDHKDKGIRFAAVRRDAVAVTTALMNEDWSDEKIKKEIDKWINYFETQFYVDRAF